MNDLTDIENVLFHANTIKIGQYGLSKMNRNHIHMAHGLPGENGVISGMRQRCDLYIHIDTAKALGGNIQTRLLVMQDYVGNVFLSICLCWLRHVCLTDFFDLCLLFTTRWNQVLQVDEQCDLIGRQERRWVHPSCLLFSRCAINGRSHLPQACGMMFLNRVLILVVPC